jgi:hypothetical protein
VSRLVPLFTGQGADMPFEEACQHAWEDAGIVRLIGAPQVLQFVRDSLFTRHRRP